jgi:hypothetical protein
MRRQRPFFNTILGVIIAAGCSNLPSAPAEKAPEIQASLVQDLLLGNCPNPAVLERSVSIGPAGGTVLLGAHKLVVPAGALSRKVTITARTGTEPGNAIQFGPAGLRFGRPATLTMSFANCTGWGVLRQLPLIVYTDDFLSILEIHLGIPNFRNKTVTSFIDHFSRYAVAY